MTELHSELDGIGVPQSRGRAASLVMVGLLATIIDIAAWYILDRFELPQGARIAIAFLPVPPDIILMAMILRRIRRLDEFQRRVHLEAVALGFMATGAAVFAYGYLQKAGAVGPLTMPLVWAFMLIFYGVGYLLAMKRYQ